MERNFLIRLEHICIYIHTYILKQKCHKDNTFTACDELIHATDILGTYFVLGIVPVACAWNKTLCCCAVYTGCGGRGKESKS
jgi:hypothetical protein